MSTSKTKDKYQIAVVPGDGIGKEVMEAAIYVLDSLGIDFEYIYGEAGDECLEKNGTALPAETLKEDKEVLMEKYIYLPPLSLPLQQSKEEL